MTTLADRKMEAALARIAKSLEEREAAKVYQFPFWPAPARGVPNEFIRSALFAAIHSKDRTYLDNREIACQDGFRIVFTGQRLDQSHLDVFEGVMHIARGTHEGNNIQFSAHSLLKLIGRSTGKSDHDWLFRTLQQLTATSVALFKGQDQVFWGSLLPNGAGALKTGGYVVHVNRNLIRLFDRGFTNIDWEHRRLLRRKPLAQWLHLYYSSHARPFPVHVSWIRQMSGSKTAQLRAFRQNLKIALEEIKTIGVITSWRISDDDKVSVERVRTASQQRFLEAQEPAAG